MRMMQQASIHVGIGGWTYEPWRGTFYPDGLPQKRELEHASRHVTAIEINGTYYRLQKPESFAAWAKAAPPEFMFSVKASRYCTNRKDLAEAGESVERFVAQGLTELGPKLGPILWQLAPTKRFDPDEMREFLGLLPARQDGVRLRHAIEARHESFRDPAFLELARKAGAAIVFADAADHPEFADLTSGFVYARLQNARENEPAGYAAADLDRWAEVARSWASGEQPEGLRYIGEREAETAAREVFLFFINGAKVRAPAAAQALIDRLRS